MSWRDSKWVPSESSKEPAGGSGWSPSKDLDCPTPARLQIKGKGGNWTTPGSCWSCHPGNKWHGLDGAVNSHDSMHRWPPSPQGMFYPKVSGISQPPGVASSGSGFSLWPPIPALPFTDPYLLQWPRVHAPSEQSKPRSQPLGVLRS